jgi:hypothetical protein
MIESYWRIKCRPIIEKIVLENKDKPEIEVRKLLSAAYPFGERRYHPYKVWLDEIKRQTGKMWPVGHKQKWLNQRKRMSKDQARLNEWESLYGRREA